EGALDGAPVAARRIGTTGGNTVTVGGASISLAALRDAYEGFFPTLMGRKSNG
ncbi:MAG: hypothetical protein H3C62_18400, partial [Gemmatimonadaceae bacterium]|nr:hypothetical protein [Gemmatimonadaceae bacterium]